VWLFLILHPAIVRHTVADMDSTARDALDQVHKVLGSLAWEDSDATER
jgi:hypothetical protein